MKKYAMAAVCGFLSVGVYAETTNTTAVSSNTVAEANQTVITATRIETPIKQTGSSITVITAEEIQQKNAENLQEALRSTPGLQCTANGGPGADSSVFIRGAESDHTLVLINGVRVNSNTDGGFDFSSLPADMIETIEVVRGPQSGLYGSDALGGVIHITTKKGAEQKPGGSLSLAVGEKGYRTASAALNGGNEIVDVNTALSFYNLENHDIAGNNGGTEDDPYKRISAYTGFGLNFLKDGRADLTILYTEDESNLDAFGGIDNPLDRSNKKKLFTLLAISKPVVDFYTQRVSVGYSRQKYEGFTSGMFGGSNAFESVSYDASAQADFFAFDNDTLSIGYDFRRSEAENKGNFDKQRRDQHAVFLHNSLNLNDIFFLNLSARYDTFSDIDSKATWKADAAYFITKSTRVHGSIGTGYRAPTMNDLYFTYGGPARTYLQPEQSRSFDIGVEQTLLDEKLVVDITFFKSDVQDLIAWAPTGPGGSYQPANINEARIEGVEFTLTATPTRNLTTKVFYTYTDSKDAATGNELARRAKNNGGVSAKWDYSERGSVHAGCTYTGKRYDDGTNTRKLNRFTVVNAGTRYQLTDLFSVFANVDNLFDQEYETAAGYGTVGRLASVGIKCEF